MLKVSVSRSSKMDSGSLRGRRLAISRVKKAAINSLEYSEDLVTSVCESGGQLQVLNAVDGSRSRHADPETRSSSDSAGEREGGGDEGGFGEHDARMSGLW